MIIVIFVVSILLFIGGAVYFTIRNDMDEDAGGIGMLMGLVGGLTAIASFIAAIVLIFTCSTLSVIDERITMYEEENAIIEQQIADAVEQYQQYETEIFTETKSDSAITLVALYPELKADTLVQKQIEVYFANNEKIKELKEEQIMASVYRWWLYFGK